MAPNVCRLATRKKQNELISMCTSSASTSRLKTPSRRPGIQDARGDVDRGRIQVTQDGGLGNVLAAVDVLDADQANEIGVRLVVIEGQLGQSTDRRDGVEVFDIERLLGGADFGIRLLEHGEVEPLFAAEVVVDHALGGARARGNLVDARAGVPAIGEFAARNGEDVRPGPRGVANAFAARPGAGAGGHRRAPV